MSNRRYLPTLSELVDRLSIAQLKEVLIAEHKDEYAKEIADIVHDIQLYIKESKELIVRLFSNIWNTDTSVVPSPGIITILIIINIFC